MVAAGAHGTAQVGAETLRRGGNAVDAVVAACVATAAFEPALTSLAGGGVMLVVDGATGRPTIVDFFSNVPGLGTGPTSAIDFSPVTVDFGAAKQVFQIGRGAAAVPGTLLGLGKALARFGRLSMQEVVAPTCAHLRSGVELDAFQASTFKLLEPILTHSAEARSVFAPAGRLLDVGETFRNVATADVLEDLAAVGVDAFCKGPVAEQLIADYGPRVGGKITEQDIANYRVIFSQPLERSYRDAVLATHFWPSHGGTLVAAMLALFEDLDIGAMGRGTPVYLATLGAAMRVCDEIKHAGMNPFDADHLNRWRARFAELRADPHQRRERQAQGRGSTTHISAIDGDGNGASVTVSYGEGCGHMLGNTGMMLNNFMGEGDLHPDGFFSSPPGERLPTNMCPTAVKRGGGLIMLGSGGANRIRTAIAQVLVNLIDFGCEPLAAVEAGRLHIEDGVVNAEVFDLPDADRILAAIAGDDEVQTSLTPNLYFGGVHLAARDAGGVCSGAGDPRRSGSVVVVP